MTPDQWGGVIFFYCFGWFLFLMVRSHRPSFKKLSPRWAVWVLLQSLCWPLFVVGLFGVLGASGVVSLWRNEWVWLLTPPKPPVESPHLAAATQEVEQLLEAP